MSCVAEDVSAFDSVSLEGVCFVDVSLRDISFQEPALRISPSISLSGGDFLLSTALLGFASLLGISLRSECVNVPAYLRAHMPTGQRVHAVLSRWVSV